jgi:hypothetical protein
MIGGTANLDDALISLERVLKVAVEEKQSIDYTHVNAPLAGKTLFDRMPMADMIEFFAILKKSTDESKDNINKLFAILKMTTEILDHYAKLAEIGDTWEGIIEKNIDDSRCYQ